MQILHKTQQYQLIFRGRDGVQVWNEYIEAETLQDAVEVAKNYLAAGCAKYPDAGVFSSWKEDEVWKVMFRSKKEEGVLTAVVVLSTGSYG